MANAAIELALTVSVAVPEDRCGNVEPSVAVLHDDAVDNKFERPAQGLRV